MFAAQLIRVLQTLPPNVNDQTCVLDTVELEANMKENQNWATFEDNDKDEFWKHSELEWDHDLGPERDNDDNGSEIGNKEKEFVASSIIPINKSESLKGRDLFTDKNVTECGLPEIVVCYRENTIKDICIDEGMHIKETTLLDHEIGKDLVSDNSLKEPKSLLPNGFDGDIGNDGGSRSNVRGIELNGSDKTKDDETSRKFLSDSMPLSANLSEPKSLKTLFDSRSSDASDVEHQIQNTKTSGSPTVVSPDGESNKYNSKLSYNSKIEKGTITFDFNSNNLAPESINEGLDKNDDDLEHPVGMSAPPTHESVIYNNIIAEKEVQRGQGESSFSMAGPVSSLVTHSGSIPYSGSISIRSDSSATSARSFAFPILPNEWNSSPVRMAKADRRRYRRDRGWKHSLFCCKF